MSQETALGYIDSSSGKSYDVHVPGETPVTLEGIASIYGSDLYPAGTPVQVRNNDETWEICSRGIACNELAALFPMDHWYGNWSGTNHIPGSFKGRIPMGTGSVIKVFGAERPGSCPRCSKLTN